MVKRLLRGSKLLAATLSALVVVVGAVGLLYLLRPSTDGWPGPVVRNTLPLDQLAGHDGVRLFAFVLVWGGAGLVLGALAHVARIERLTAGLLGALLTGAVLYATTGFSIYVVQQIQAGSAFHNAVYTPAVYLATAFAGLGGAALGRPYAGLSKTGVLRGSLVGSYPRRAKDVE
jgi:hypothetical protein